MTFFDKPLEELRIYAPLRTNNRIRRILAAHAFGARNFPLNAKFEPADTVLRSVQVFDVTFSGYGGHRIKGWLLLPLQPAGKLPCVVEFIGYGGGRGFPTDWLLWSSAGYAHLVMDTRGRVAVGSRVTLLTPKALHHITLDS